MQRGHELCSQTTLHHIALMRLSSCEVLSAPHFLRPALARERQLPLWTLWAGKAAMVSAQQQAAQVQVAMLRPTMRLLCRISSAKCSPMCDAQHGGDSAYVRFERCCTCACTTRQTMALLVSAQVLAAVQIEV